VAQVWPVSTVESRPECDGVVFVVGPIREKSPGLVEVEVSALGFDSIFTEILTFGWDGHDWVPASSGEGGVTVSTLN
jgi:hypothetical protein